MHRWMWIKCQNWPDSKVDRTYKLNHKIYHNRERNVGTIANVGTIEGIAQVGTISAYLSLSEGGFGPKFGMTLCKGGFGPTFGKVGTIQGWN